MVDVGSTAGMFSMTLTGAQPVTGPYVKLERLHLRTPRIVRPGRVTTLGCCGRRRYREPEALIEESLHPLKGGFRRAPYRFAP